jgi:hypothetical protein
MARRRFVLATSAALAALILVASVIGWYIYDAQHEEAVASAAKALTRLVDDQNTDEGRRYYDDLSKKNPAIASRPEIQQELGRLNGLVTKEENRKQSFEAFLKRAVEAGVDDPDRSAVVEADKFAKALDEKSRLSEWRAKINAADRERQRTRDQHFESDFKNLLAEVEKLERNIHAEQRLGGSGNRRFFGAIDQLIARIDNAKQAANGVTTSLVAQLEPLRIRVQALRQNIADAQKQQSSLARLTATVGRPENYQAALESFINENPESPLSAEFKQVLVEEKWWKDVDRWKAFYADFHFADLGHLSPRDAKDLLAAGDALLKEAGDSPLSAQLKDKRQLLQHVASRVDQSGKSALDELERLFEDRRISNLWMVTQVPKDYTTIERWRFYLTSRPDLSESKSGQFPLKIVTGFDLSEKIQSIPQTEIGYSDRSPQSKIVEEIKHRGLFRRIRDGEWEKCFVELMQLIVSQKDLDPLLQLILLRRVVETGRQGSHSLNEAWTPLWKRIEDVQVDVTANWLWPHDENAKRSRAKSAELLAKLESGEAINQYARLAAELFRKDLAPLPTMPTFIGWLHPAAADSWSCDGPNAMPQIGELFVLTPSSNGGPITPVWQQIGTCDATGIQWESVRDARFVAGRPIYYFPQ